MRIGEVVEVEFVLHANPKASANIGTSSCYQAKALLVVQQLLRSAYERDSMKRWHVARALLRAVVPFHALGDS